MRMTISQTDATPWHIIVRMGIARPTHTLVVATGPIGY